MADIEYETGTLSDQLRLLRDNIAATAEVAGSFNSQFNGVGQGIEQVGDQASQLSQKLNGRLSNAFHQVIFSGVKASDVLQNVARSLLSTALNNATQPVSDGLSLLVSNSLVSLLGGILGFEKGGAFISGKVTPFAQGGIVGAPTLFPMQNNMGLMGEAGAEAIMPLARGADGRLGVQSSGSAGTHVNVTMNISTPDVHSFNRSRSQIAAAVGRAIQTGARNS